MREKEITEVLGPIALLVAVAFSLGMALMLKDGSPLRPPPAAGTYVCDGGSCSRVADLEVVALGDGRVRVDGREFGVRELGNHLRYERGADAAGTIRIERAAGATARDVAQVAAALAAIGFPATSLRIARRDG